MSTMNVENDYPKSAAEVWALFRETDLKMQETRQLIKEIALLQKETDRKMQETDRQMKETDRKMGKLINTLGEIVEHLVAPGMKKKFRKLGYHFEYSNTNTCIERADTGQTIAEMDVWLTNGEYALAVEVKSKLTTEYVNEHVDRLEKIREYFNDVGDKRKILGAVAGAIVEKNVRDYAIKKGFFVMAQSGDTMLLDIPKGFKPREW